LSGCQQVRVLLPALDFFHRQGAATIKRLREEHKNNVEFAKLADFYAALNAKDRAGLELRRQEMTLSSEMSKMPPSKRQAFFEQQIRPTRHDASTSEQATQPAFPTSTFPPHRITPPGLATMYPG
jgi:hypothetical protein